MYLWTILFSEHAWSWQRYWIQHFRRYCTFWWLKERSFLCFWYVPEHIPSKIALTTTKNFSTPFLHFSCLIFSLEFPLWSQYSLAGASTIHTAPERPPPGENYTIPSIPYSKSENNSQVRQDFANNNPEYHL